MKLAFIGSGKIVQDALIAITPIKTIEKSAIFARPHSREKAETIASQYGIKKVYCDYNQLLEESEADTVYIGLINSAHFSYAKEALLNGKNVILEKPVTGFGYEAAELQKIAREKGLCIVEAVTILHNEVLGEMQKNIEKLGTVRMFQANFSQYSSRYDNYLKGEIEHSFDPKYYGGALYDINVYNIHYCVALFGEPKEVKYYPNIGPNGIDISGTLIMTYEGFMAICMAAKDSDSPGFVCVQGEKGYMRIEGKPNVAATQTTVYVDESIKEKVKDAAGGMVRATITEAFEAEPGFHRMTKEFEDFAEIIDSKDLARADELMTESVTVAKILDAARESAGIHEFFSNQDYDE